jgi:hypothetical protein
VLEADGEASIVEARQAEVGHDIRMPPARGALMLPEERAFVVSDEWDLQRLDAPRNRAARGPDRTAPAFAEQVLDAQMSDLRR